jgi:D-sedoheptulose 7-phosphate isomerase
MSGIKKSDNLHKHIDTYLEQLHQTLNKLDKDVLERIIDIIMKAYRDGKKVFIMGNGGSASNASHMACDFSKGTLRRVYDEEERRFKVYSLTDNVSIISAFANDCSYDEIFTQQLRNLVEKGDVVIALSGSGNSNNVINAVRYAKKCRAHTVGILGFKTGGVLASLVDDAIVADSMSYGVCEDIQLILDHIITSWIGKTKHLHDRKLKRKK